MSILLWYFPFMMFSSACDIAFSMPNAQMPARRPADAAERTLVCDDHGYDRFD